MSLVEVVPRPSQSLQATGEPTAPSVLSISLSQTVSPPGVRVLALWGVGLDCGQKPCLPSPGITRHP